MSTQTDFAALVVRIDAATDRLEMDVMELEKLINDAEGAVSEELTELVAQAKASANAAAMSAQTATQAANSASMSNNNAAIEANRAAAQVTLAQAEVTKAIAQVQLAKDEVVKATQEADRAKTEADRANTIATNLLTSAPFQEAPINGNTYGRKNGEWSVVGTGSGGAGTVISVNGVEPDTEGNVQIDIPVVPTVVSAFTNDAGYIKASELPTVPTKTSELTNDSGFITIADVPAAPAVPTKVSQLENDSNFATVSQLPTKTSQLTNDSAFITLAEVPASPIATDAPSDGKQYARKDNTWSEVEAASGGGSTGYTLQRDFYRSSDGSCYRWFANHKLFELTGGEGSLIADASILAQITPADWNGDARIPLTTNPWMAVDIRFLSLKKVVEATGEVLEDDLIGTKVEAGKLVSHDYLYFYGASSANVMAGAIRTGCLPGKWHIPGALVTLSGTAAATQGLPTSMNGYDIILESSMVPLAVPVGGRRNLLLTFWNLNKPTASKMSYLYQVATSTWVNVGTGTN